MKWLILAGNYREYLSCLEEVGMDRFSDALYYHSTDAARGMGVRGILYYGSFWSRDDAQELSERAHREFSTTRSYFYPPPLIQNPMYGPAKGQGNSLIGNTLGGGPVTQSNAVVWDPVGSGNNGAPILGKALRAISNTGRRAGKTTISNAAIKKLTEMFEDKEDYL